MKILDNQRLAIGDVSVIRFGRFKDDRGYFTEPFRQSDFDSIPALAGQRFVQSNESYSRAGTVRGFHFQWNPFMGKLVRTISGRMVDIAIDIRLNSPTFGCAVAYDMPSKPDSEYGEWIWVPPGFAHGNFFSADTLIEYLCTGEYSPGCEAGLSPLAPDINWDLCDSRFAGEFQTLIQSNQLIISDKDRVGLTLQDWAGDPRSENFMYELLGNGPRNRESPAK